MFHFLSSMLTAMSSLMLFVLTSSLTHQATISNSWTYYNESCYTITQQPAGTYYTKSQECFDLESNMLEIETAGEMDFIRNMIEQSSYSGQMFWVGLEYVDVRQYRWVTSQQAPHDAFWREGEPSQKWEGCIRLTNKKTGVSLGVYLLADLRCNNTQQHVICEKPAAVTSGGSTSVFYSSTSLTSGIPLCREERVSMTSQVTSPVQCAVVCTRTPLCVGVDWSDVGCDVIIVKEHCDGEIYTPSEHYLQNQNIC